MNKKTNPQVTVLMSVYNGEKYLREAMESILNQTFADFEFLIINDASSDRSREIILAYADERICLVDNEQNIGLTCSLNKGLKLAKGKYIARQDADDISLPQRLEKQLNFLNNNTDVGLLGSSCIKMTEDGSEIYVFKAATDNLEIKKRLEQSNQFCHGSVMFRKCCVDSVGGYREKLKYAQDYDLWLRIAEKHKVANLGEALYKLRVGFESITYKKMFEQFRYALLIQKLNEERSSIGTDKLDSLDDPAIAMIMEELLPENSKNESQVLANGYIAWAEDLYFMSHNIKAVSVLIKVFRQSFWLKRAWILCLKIVVSCLLPEKFISFLRSFKVRLNNKCAFECRK